MPQSITIAAFVFGAVLLLIAIVGGGFKIFGAEVSGSAGKGGRLGAGLAGVILLCVGLFGSFDKTGAPSALPANSNAQQKASAPTTTPAPSNLQPAPQPAQNDSKFAANKATGTAGTDNSQEPPQQSAPVEQNVNIGGIWRDAMGTVFEVSQQGSSYTFRATGVNFVSAGSGMVHGHQLESTYETQYVNGARSAGRCAGTISPDGRQTRSTCVDNVNGQWESISVR